MKLDIILERTVLLFLKSGFSKVNTDQISEHAGVSKRTLYKYFDTKDKLINAVINKIHNNLGIEFDKIIKSKELNPIEKLKSITAYVTETSSRFSKEFFKDIQFYRSDLYDTIKNNRRIQIQSLVSVLEDGQKLGYIRKDIDPQFAIDVLLASAEEVLKPSNLAVKDYNGKSAHSMLFRLFLEGVQHHSDKNSHK